MVEATGRISLARLLPMCRSTISATVLLPKNEKGRRRCNPITERGRQTPKVVSQSSGSPLAGICSPREKRVHSPAQRAQRKTPTNCLGMKVEKNYVFDGPNGKESLSDLSAHTSAHSLYHFLCLGPDWRKVARAAHSSATILRDSCASQRSRRSRSRRFSRAPCHKSRLSRSAWAGASSGSLPTHD